MITKYSSSLFYLIVYFMSFKHMEYGSCLLFHSHVNDTQSNPSSVSADSSTIHQLLAKQLSYMENTVGLLSEKVSHAETEMTNVKQRLIYSEQKNAELSQRLVLLEKMCNCTDSTLQEDRLKKLEGDLRSTVLQTRTLAVNDEKDRNRTFYIEKTLSVHKDELRNVQLFLMQASTKSEEINSTLERHINDSALQFHRVFDENNNINETINKMVSDIIQGRLVSQHFIDAIKKLESRVLDVQNHVGFTVGSTIDNSWAGSTLLFNKLIYNMGGGYNTSTGVFTSPISGTFIFYVAVVSAYDTVLYLDIMFNGAGKVRTMSYYPSAAPLYQTGTNLLLIHLQAGDRVWIHNNGNGEYFTNGDVPIVTFSGFRL